MDKYQDALDEIKGLEIYDDDSDGNTCYKRKFKHCSNCGQAIDWSEE